MFILISDSIGCIVRVGYFFNIIKVAITKHRADMDSAPALASDIQIVSVRKVSAVYGTII